MSSPRELWRFGLFTTQVPKELLEYYDSVEAGLDLEKGEGVFLEPNKNFSERDDDRSFYLSGYVFAYTPGQAERKAIQFAQRIVSAIGNEYDHCADTEIYEGVP